MILLLECTTPISFAPVFRWCFYVSFQSHQIYSNVNFSVHSLCYSYYDPLNAPLPLARSVFFLLSRCYNLSYNIGFLENKIILFQMTIEDIEDLTKNISNGVLNRDDAFKFKIRINPRYRKEDLEDVHSPNDLSAENRSFLPGKFSIYLRTWGCTHNSSDSEYMAGLLVQSGYRVAESPEEADLWILNSCTVKNPSEDRFRNEINQALSKNKKLVVAGCVPQSDHKSPYLSNISVIGVQQIDKVVEVVEETLKGNVVRYLGIQKEGKRKTGGASLHMPKIRRNPLIEIIPINTGCLNQCTYCKTKHARGNLGSYHIQDILYRAQTAFLEGVKELWITSEDTGAYGRDIGTSLPELLFELVKIIPPNCMLRLGMTNPPYILEHIESMATILQHPRVYSFLHIPIQSGSDPVLADMKREYSVDDFCQIVNYLKKEVPGITIATDIICGFPTETKDNFNETLELLANFKFPVLFINQFYPRPGTPAAKMRRIDTKEVKRRSIAASELFNSYGPYEERIGKRYRVLITEESTDKEYFVGHNKFYEQILIPKNECNLGDSIDIEVIAFGKHYMIGKPISSKLSRWKDSIIKNQSIFGKIWLTSCSLVLISAIMYKVYRRL
ncbi:Threonylcarbamoyladenosine tRNA methylthiotransferase [Blomia tropicalis]|nr:Threonylcarbamoyladenosine tRNA methylthiotransferase [Blomia tropicalis]